MSEEVVTLSDVTLNNLAVVVRYSKQGDYLDGRPLTTKPASPDDVLAAVRSLIAENGVAWLLDGLEGAEKVEWCDFHAAQGTTLGFCFVGAAPYSEAYKDCVIVDRYVVPVDPGGTE